MSSASEGVFKSTRSGRFITIPTAPRKTLIPRNVKNAVLTAVFIAEKLRAPKYLLTITEEPTPPPIATQIKTTVSEYDAPTAASACSPTNRPTTAESTIV